jgi:hypothetical protein
VSNTAAAGAGTLTVSNGTSANPTININFPSSGGTPTLPAWTSSTTYTAGQLVTHNNAVFFAFSGNTASELNEPGTSGGIGIWGGISVGSGAAPVGIPYAISGHVLGYANVLYASPSSAVQSTTVNATTVVVAPTACTPSFTIYSYAAETATFTLETVKTPSLNTYVVDSAISGASCTTAAWSSGNAKTCTATASAQIPAGTPLTLAPSQLTNSSNTYGSYILAFSCQ